MIITNLYCLFLSSSRTGVFGLLVFFVCVFINNVDSRFNDKKKKHYIYFFATVFLIILLAYVLFQKKDVSFILGNIISDPFTALDKLTSKRMQILYSVLNIIRKRPLLGNGWNSSIPIGQGESVAYYPYAHNIYLGALAWTGLLGFIILAIESVSLLFLIKNNKKATNNQFLCYIIISILFEAQFENGIFGDWNHAYTYLFWIITGFLSF